MIILISSLIILVLFGCNAFAEGDELRTLFTENFEASGDFNLSADENSKAQITPAFGADGTATNALNLKGSSAFFDAAKGFGITECVIEFDFLPQNITEDGFVAFSMLSEDNLAQIPVLSFAGEALYFMGEEIAQSVHIDWYKIKIVVGEDAMCIFLNNRQKGEAVPLVEGFDLIKATLRFAVSGSNGKNSIYIDNINIFNPEQGEVLIENCDFLRYECAIDEILPGEIEASISLYNYDGENTAKSLRLLVGLFDEKGMCKASATLPVSVNGGECITLTQVIEIPKNADDYEIRVFGWDENMVPYNNISILD